jgi:hypothetical protein
MREKSQIEDMRAALRGDIERARARREADPWRSPEPERPVTAETPTAPPGLTGSVPAEPVDEPETMPLPEPEPEPDPEPEPAPEPEPVAEAREATTEPQSDAPPATEPGAQGKRRGFFARLFGRG